MNAKMILALVCAFCLIGCTNKAENKDRKEDSKTSILNSNLVVVLNDKELPSTGASESLTFTALKKTCSSARENRSNGISVMKSFGQRSSTHSTKEGENFATKSHLELITSVEIDELRKNSGPNREYEHALIKKIDDLKNIVKSEYGVFRNISLNKSLNNTMTKIDLKYMLNDNILRCSELVDSMDPIVIEVIEKI